MQAQATARELEDNVRICGKLIGVFNERPAIRRLRRQFAVREAIVRLVVFVAVVVTMAVVSPFSGAYPSATLSRERESLCAGLQSTFSQV